MLKCQRRVSYPVSSFLLGGRGWRKPPLPVSLEGDERLSQRLRNRKFETMGIDPHLPDAIVIPRWVMFNKKIPSRAVVVYGALQTFPSTPEHVCTPSVADIRLVTGYTAKTIRRALNDLVDAGAIEKYNRWNHQSGGCEANAYGLFFEGPER